LIGSRIPWIHELGEGHRVRVPLLISRSNIADIGMGRFGSAWYIHLPSFHRNSLGACSRSSATQASEPMLTKHVNAQLESRGYTVEFTRYFGFLQRCSPMSGVSSPIPLGRGS